MCDDLLFLGMNVRSSMNSLGSKILIYIGAILLWWSVAQSATAGILSDRLERYPNWDTQPQVRLHQGELEYPEWFRGRWIVTSTLIEQIAPLAPEIVTPGFESNRQYINKKIEFTVQFIPQVASKSAPVSPLNLPKLTAAPAELQIVADRAFNGLNIVTAYLGKANIKSVKIDPQNPTKQITQLTQNRQLEAFVTGFDREIPQPDRFIATEVSQQVFRTDASIYLNTVETTTSYQYSAAPTPTITAVQISAIYLSPQDPNYFRTLSPPNPRKLFLSTPTITNKIGQHPVALYKYQLKLVSRSSLN
jgi:hypothetical protein